MFNLEEVIPDSQDEGSLLDFEVEVERDVSPPANLPPRGKLGLYSCGMFITVIF